MNKRIEQVLNQIENWDSEQKNLISQLMINVSEKMIADIITAADNQYPKLGLIIHPDKELYYKIPNPELYIEMYRRILGLDFGPDAQLYLADIDPESIEGMPKSDVPIYIGITIFWPDEDQGLFIGPGIIPDRESVRMNISNVTKVPQVMENTFFTPYLARMIRNLYIYFQTKEEYLDMMMKLILTIHQLENQE